jgi:hypothetical protein
VVAIGHVGTRDVAVKNGGDGDALAQRQPPDLMTHAVRCRQIIERGLFFCDSVDQSRDTSVAAIGEENGAGVCAKRIHEPGAIVLFVRPGLLVFFDDVVLVVPGVANGHESGLTVITHDLAVCIHGGTTLAQKDSVLLQFQESRTRFFVNGRGIWVDILVQVDLSPIDVKKVERVVFGEFVGLFTVHHIIGNSGDGGCESRCGNETGKGTDAHEKRR